MYWLPFPSVLRAEYLPFNSKVTDLRTFWTKTSHSSLLYNCLWLNPGVWCSFLKMHTSPLNKQLILWRLESIKLFNQVKLSKINLAPRYWKKQWDLDLSRHILNHVLQPMKSSTYFLTGGSFSLGCFLAFLPLLDISVVECFGCWFKLVL